MRKKQEKIRKHPKYPPLPDQEDVEIVLQRSYLKTIFKFAVTYTMTLFDGRILSVLRSCADEQRLAIIGPTASITVGTANGEQVCQNALVKMVSNATVQVVTQNRIMSRIFGKLTKIDKFVSLIATFLAKTVKQEARKVQHVMEKLTMEVILPPLPSSGQSYVDQTRETKKPRRDRRE